MSEKETTADGSANTSSDKTTSAATDKPAAKAATKASAKARAPAKKLSASDKSAADAAIKSKKGSDDLKARAAAAKKRAQEKILDKSYVSDPPEDPLERLANTFDNSARRWEMVVYPSLFAFVLLAGYGFFLIYRLTHDIAVLSQSVTHMAVIVSDVMPRMSKDLTSMTSSVDNMTGNIAGMSGDIGGMTNEIGSMSEQMNTLTPMSKNIQSMTHNLGSMNRSVYGMQRDIGGMNRTVSSGPFGMMNDMMPFSSKSNVPRPIPPSPVWPAYNSGPQQAYTPSQMRQQPQRRQQPAASARAGVKPEVKKQSSEVTSKKKQLNSNVVRKSTVQEISIPGARPVSLKN